MIERKSTTKGFVSGFTLLELLIVIGIIIILAAALILALDPVNHFKRSRDSTRDSHLKFLESRLYLHQLEKYDFPEGIELNVFKEICNTDKFKDRCHEEDLVDLSGILPEGVRMPIDPQGSLGNYGTGYRVARHFDVVLLHAPKAESRLVAIGDIELAYDVCEGVADGGQDVGCDSPCRWCQEEACAWAFSSEEVEYPNPGGHCKGKEECSGGCLIREYLGYCDQDPNNPDRAACAYERHFPDMAGSVCQEVAGEPRWVDRSKDAYCGADYYCSPESCTGSAEYWGCLEGQNVCAAEAGEDPDHEALTEEIIVDNNRTLTADCKIVSAPYNCQWCQGGEQPESRFRDSRNNPELINTVQINNQCWLAQNMNIGTIIDVGSNQSAGCDNIRKYCYENNEAFCGSDGGLYQWNQAMCGLTYEGARGICPAGWRIPANKDWDDLVNVYNGLELQSGGESGFKGKLAGHRSLNGTFAGQGEYGVFWASSQFSADTAWYRMLYDSESEVYWSIFDKRGGFSVRCIWAETQD